MIFNKKEEKPTSEFSVPLKKKKKKTTVLEILTSKLYSKESREKPLEK